MKTKVKTQNGKKYTVINKNVDEKQEQSNHVSYKGVVIWFTN